MDETNLPGGPHLAAAFLCERVLQEKDGVQSIIRIFDRTIVRSNQREMSPTPIQATAFISFKAGSQPVGKYRIRLRPQKPDGSYLAEQEFEVFFQGTDEHGVNITAQLTLVVEEEGLYWIDVFFEDALQTRIPLRILHQSVGRVIGPNR